MENARFSRARVFCHFERVGLMIEIAGGIVLAVVFLLLLPLLIRGAGYLLGIAAAIVGAILAVYMLVMGVAGSLYVVNNWEAVSGDYAFWLTIAGALAFWAWLVFVAKPDWLRRS
jgi:hypothetical protein